MKSAVFRTFFLFVLLLLSGSTFYSCSKVTPLVGLENIEITSLFTRSSLETMKGDTNHYSVSEEIGAAFIAMHYPDKEFELQPIVKECDTLLFLCNFEEGGWLLLAGDKRSRPILGESESEHLFLVDVPEGIRVWIDMCCDDIRYLKEASDIQSNHYTDLWDALFPSHRRKANENKKSQHRDEDDCKWCVFKRVYPVSSSSSYVISPMTSTLWGVHSPWNTKLPYYVDSLANYSKCGPGSAAVAMAQLLYYTHYHLGKPNGLYHNIQVSQSYIYSCTANIGFSRADYVSNSTRWDAMPTDSMPPGTPMYTEDLMLDIGNRIGMQYMGEANIGFPSLSVLSTYYSLYGEMDDYQETLVRNSLEDSMPVIITAYARPNVGAHTWLIEGLYRTVVEYEMEIHIEYSDQWMYANEYFESFDELRQYYHTDYGGWQYLPADPVIYDYWLMNWGYDGEYNDGHFSVNSNATWGNRTYDKTIYYGFE